MELSPSNMRAVLLMVMMLRDLSLATGEAVIHHEGKSEREIKKGTCRQELKQKPWRNAAYSEEPHRNLINNSLCELSCHFTWTLNIEDVDMPDLERRIINDLPDPNNTMRMLNLLAYVRHLTGQHEEALQSLNETEALIQEEPLGKRSLVTWGNCAWVHYHMGSLAEAQTYLDKVENTCKEFASPFRYRMECAEMYCEQGWALLKCGKQNYRGALECFAKALEAEPENPEYNTGYAIAAYRLDFNDSSISLEPLRKAVRLNPEDPYIKVLLALKLQNLGKSDEAITYVEEARDNITSQTDVFGHLAKFYQLEGFVEKALYFLDIALQAKPFSAFLHYQTGRCYKTQLIQIKNATNMQPRGQDRERADQLIRLAMDHFQKTLELKPTYEIAYVHLAEMYIEIGQLEEAEENFQKALSMRGTDATIQQDIHYRYGHFQLYQKRSEETAITHYIKGLKIEVTSSCFKDKLLKALKDLAERRIRRNFRVVEGFGLLGFVYRLRGDTSDALEYYEKALRLTETLNPEF